MDDSFPGARGTPAAGMPTTAPDARSPTPSAKDHFLRLMLFQASHERGEAPAPPRAEQASGAYAPLRHATAAAGDRFGLPLPNTVAPVQLDSPAVEVMTDLRKVGAVTIDRDRTIGEANRVMVARGVRALFAVDDGRRVFGILTSTDIQGERPIQFAQERGLRHDEIVVRDIMTPADRLEILDLRDVTLARVGDIIATLKLAGRQHALVVEAGDGAAGQQHTVRGIFSLTQIARQMGIPPQQVHDIARTFAEIERVIGG